MALIALGMTLPFELEKPWLAAGPFLVTNVELILGLFLLLATWTGRRQIAARTAFPGGRGWLLAIGCGVLLSTWFAPDHSLNAVKAALRLAAGAALALAVPLVVRTRRAWWGTAAALAAGALAAALAGLAESWPNRELAWLAPFRPAPTVAGQFIRLSGTFDYANQAAMFFEAVVPFWVMGGWLVYRRLPGRRSRLIFLFPFLLLSLVFLQAIFLTLSRAALVTLVLTGLLLPLALGRRGRGEQRTPWLVFAAATFLVAAGNLLLNPAFLLRLQSEGDSTWYHLQLDVTPVLRLETDEIKEVPVTLTNEGALAWRSAGRQPINLAARWIHLASGLQVAEPRWPFPEPVFPGETVTLAVPLAAPPYPGRYRLEWDVVQEQITWFGAKNGRLVSSQVTIDPGPDAAARPVDRLPAGAGSAVWTFPPSIPGRLTLWRTALTLLGRRPWLGIGLDNFRLTYGPVLGQSAWNETVHTNSWLLELLVSLGWLGAAPFLLWLGWLGVSRARALRRPAVTAEQIAAAAALLAFFIHGLFDFFLLFNATGLLFWLLVGLAAAADRLPAGASRGDKAP